MKIVDADINVPLEHTTKQDKNIIQRSNILVSKKDHTSVGINVIKL
jgi:hypothetical protein